MGIVVYNDTLEKDVSDVVRKFAEEVARAAEKAASDLYMIDNYADSGNAKFQEWYDAARLFLETHSKPDFINARYGYAVEEYVNSKIDSKKIMPPRGYKVRLQVTHGDTRPDIVILTMHEVELAWMDITSSNNRGHIYGKAGNWQSARGFVAELLYTDLDLSKICRGTSIASNCAPRILRAAALMNRRYMNHMRSCLTRVLARAHSAELSHEVSFAYFAMLIEEYFEIGLPGCYKHPIIHSMLKMYIDDPCSLRKEDAGEWIGKYRSNRTAQDKAAAMSYITDSYNKNDNFIELFDNSPESDDSGDEEFDPNKFFDREFVFV